MVLFYHLNGSFAVYIPPTTFGASHTYVLSQNDQDALDSTYFSSQFM